MDIASLIEAGSTSIVYLAAGGLVLGSLHGLEPGHSKTMMAAFIIAVRGSVSHAVLLGVSAAFSHSIIVWILAWLALTYGNELIGEQQIGFQLLASGAIVLVIGAWMLYGALRVRSGHDHGHHSHGPGADHAHHGHAHHGHAHHDHTDHAPAHHSHEDDVPMDAHAQAHAREIEQKFQSGAATYTQTIGFGLTGGLIPCPAAITVLLLCLNIGQFWLGVGMVAAFSTGLALTLVAVGVAAAVGLKYARKRYGSIDKFYRIAPYVSGALIMAIGVLMGYTGWIHLTP